MQKLLFLLLIMVFSAVIAQAETYSCRDKQGKLFITDNLQTLPAECQDRAQVIESEDPDNLNYVPSQAAPQGSGVKFQQAVDAAEHEQQQEKEQVEGLLLRAEQLVAQYQQAVEEISMANQRWKHKKSKLQEIVRGANDQIVIAREGKQRLLTEMVEQEVSWGNEQEIRSLLDEIED